MSKNREVLGSKKGVTCVGKLVGPHTGVNKKGNGLSNTQIRTHKKTIYTCMPRQQWVVQRKNKIKNIKKVSEEKNYVRGSSSPQHDQGVVASQSLQRNGRSSDHKLHRDHSY